MIEKVLEVLRKEIYGAFTRMPDLNVKSADAVKVSPLLQLGGETALSPNTVGMTLVNIEEERTLKSQTAAVIEPNGRISHMNPDIKLNLYILVTANFANYPTALEFLSAVIGFFQAKNVFTPQNTPSLHPNINKLIAELYTLNFEQQNHLWASLGAKYIPSVLYRVRLIVIQEAIKTDEQPRIGAMDFQGRGYSAR